MKRASGIIAATLAVVLSAPVAYAQTTSPAAKPATESPCMTPNSELCPVRTLYLSNAVQVSDLNEIVTSIRNILPVNDTKIYAVPSQNAIVVRATLDNIAIAQKLINDLDRPRKNYRLTYTVTELDGSKQIGTQHFAMIMTSGQATVLKQGSKIPIATGSYSTGGSAAGVGVQTQFSYIDVGMDFDATLTEMGNNAMLRTNVEQSSVAPEKSDVVGDIREPIVRSTSLKGESFLAPGRPLALGSMDIPGSTSHLQIEVVMEPLP